MPSPDPEQRLPLRYWFITGGIGPPPKTLVFIQMALDRKAAHREEVAYKAAKKAGNGKVEEGTRKKPCRRELRRLYGPAGVARGRPWGSRSDEGGCGEEDRDDGDGNSGDGDDGEGNDGEGQDDGKDHDNSGAEGRENRGDDNSNADGGPGEEDKR
ncbi:hypothetical protein GGS20DRAFT_586225 [Poronia punctata]|nr:hypothetical protein GGS20DRAFT_586225 [Poronia punctata]